MRYVLLILGLIVAFIGLYLATSEPLHSISTGKAILGAGLLQFGAIAFVIGLATIDIVSEIRRRKD